MCCQLGSARMGVAFPDDIMRVFLHSCYLIFKWYSNGQCSSTGRRNKRLPVWGGGVQGVYEGVAHLPKLLVGINYPTHAVRGSFFFICWTWQEKKLQTAGCLNIRTMMPRGCFRRWRHLHKERQLCNDKWILLLENERLIISRLSLCIDCTIYLMTTWPLAHTSPTGWTWTTKNNENGQ